MVLSQHGKLHAESFETDKPSTCREVRAKLSVTSCEFEKRTAKPKFVAQSRPAIYNSQQVISPGKQLEASA